MPAMSARAAVHTLTLSLVLREDGSAFYIRLHDGLVGLRRGNTLFWYAANDDLIMTELCSEDVYSLDCAILTLAEVVREWRR
jgi:hypothetical protein